MICQPNWIMFQHAVEFDPEIKSKKKRCEIFRQLNPLFNDAVAFDGYRAFALNKLKKVYKV